MKSKLTLLALSALFLPVFAEEEKAPEAPKKKKADPEKVFKKKDTNKDGFLSLEEFIKDSKDPERATKAFKRMDTDNDGKLTLKELTDGRAKGAGKGKKKKEEEAK